MKDNKHKKKKFGKAAWYIVSVALTVAGFILIPPFINKFGDKVYKKSLNMDDFDFDEMGPEIVPFEKDIKEED